MKFNSDKSYYVRIKSLPQWSLQSFKDGRYTSGVMENVVSRVFSDLSITSYGDQNAPDLTSTDGLKIEVKGKCEHVYNVNKVPTAFNLKTSYEARNGGGDSSIRKTEKRWKESAFFVLVKYRVVDDKELHCRFYAQKCEGPVIEKINSHTFEDEFAKRSIKQLDDSKW